MSDRSLAEFVLLRRAGWQALGLVFGASFVFVPRRSPIEVSAQTARSVELTNFTTALYTARSAAMERMQAQALQLEAAGVVGVRLADGPAEFAHHAMRFTALGTAVGPLGNVSDTVAPVPTVALNDPVP